MDKKEEDELCNKTLESILPFSDNDGNGDDDLAERSTLCSLIFDDNNYANHSKDVNVSCEYTVAWKRSEALSSVVHNEGELVNGIIRVAVNEDTSTSFFQFFRSTSGTKQVLLILFLYSVAAGTTVGVVPLIITNRYARIRHGYDGPECSTFNGNDKPLQCILASYDAQTAVVLCTFMNQILSFCSSPVVGSASDTHGRRGFFLTGLSIGLLSPIALVTLHHIPSMNPAWYFTASAAGGIVNWFPLCLSSLADVVPAKWRAPSFGLIMAGVIVGYRFSPLLTFAVQSKTHILYISLFGNILTFLLALGYLPETLNVQQRRHRSPLTFATNNREQLSFWSHFVFLARPLKEMKILNRSFLFRLLASLSLFSGMVFAADMTLETYYIENQLDFSVQDIAVLFALSGVISVIVQGLLLRPFIAVLGEKMVLIVAFFFATLYNILYGFARSKGSIFVAKAASSFSGMAFPTISAIKANNVDSHEQGRIQGALYSVMAIGNALGPVLMQYVFDVTKATTFPGPGGMFLFAACLEFVAVVAACFLPKEKTNSAKAKRVRNESLTDALLEHGDKE